MRIEDYTLLPLRDVQLLQLDVMKQIHRVCIKRNIKYYLIAGSVLGAVRHGGFIPWDDDIDIAMMRDDYERFKTIFYEEFEDNRFFLQHYDSDVDFKPALMRFCIKGTIRVSECEKQWHNCKNMYIDIFPLDNAPDNDLLRKKQAKKIKKLRGILSKKLYGLYPSNSGLVVSLKKVVSFAYRLYPLHLVQNKLNQVMQQYNHQQTVSVCSMASKYKYVKQCIDRSIYGDPTLLRFEDTEFFGPEQPKEYLEHLYGKDYMQLPPPEKRDQPEDVFISLELASDLGHQL